jgi:DNA topoisomerase-3
LLADFVSQRTRRKFKAFLVRDPAGKIGFEFAPRPERPERPGRPAAAPRTAAPTDEKPVKKLATVKAPAKAAAKKKAPAKSPPPKG